MSRKGKMNVVPKALVYGDIQTEGTEETWNMIDQRTNRDSRRLHVERRFIDNT